MPQWVEILHALDVVEIHPFDERIRELCAKAVTAPESEVDAILSELKALLREHIEYVRQMAAKKTGS